MTIFVSADANPDSSGRPSPVYVRIYQLKGDKPFRSADFFDVWDDEKKALGETFITRDEFFLKGGEQQKFELALARDTTFVGVVAELRDIRNVQWRGVIPAPSGSVAVTINKAGVTVTPVQ